MVTIALSLSAMMREMYALSAIRALQSRHYAEERPRLLTTDNYEALRPIVGDALTLALCALGDHLTDSNIGEAEPPEILRFELDLDGVSGSDLCLLRRCLEHATVHDALAMVWSEVNDTVAARHRERAAESLDKLRSLVKRAASTQVRIRPWRY